LKNIRNTRVIKKLIKQEQPTIGNKNDVTLYETVITEAEWSSYKERMVDALALRADERRDKLR
jgi:hypothetical protein